MDANLLQLATFHLTGERSGDDLNDGGVLNLRPALLAAYSDLSKLRYDYPLVLVEGNGAVVLQPLSRAVDGFLQEIAPPGVEGERLRKHVLRIEEEIRVLVSRGVEGPLLRLWDLAESNLLANTEGGARGPLSESLSRARSVLRFDGEVVDCDEETPAKLLTHVWTAVEKEKARRFLDRLDGLILGLSNILKADFMKSDGGRVPEILKRSVGNAYEEAFDFEAMSRVLGRASPDDVLPEERRKRIRRALSVLESQRFLARTGAGEGKGRRDRPYAFVFDSCTRALHALEERLPEMAELVKAMSIAELELENRYDASRHDAFFGRFDGSALAAEDLASFPSYLVCLRDGRCDATENETLFDALSSGLSLKVLVQSDDLLGVPAVGTGRLGFAFKSSQLASMALGLNSAFVLQSSGSFLYQLRDSILRGLTYPGPALFSVFSESAESAKAKNVPALPPYLAAAAAMESRAFPAFSYDPGAGPDWASRFRLGDNPQPEAVWPTHRFAYEDPDLQRKAEDIAFTFVDFVACDKRYAGRFARVARSKWHESMMPVSEFLERARNGAPERVPYILMVDERSRLHRVIVEDTLVEAARHCAELWRSLQELGGIDSSHARRLLEKEKEIWEREKAREQAALGPRPEEKEPGAKEPPVRRREAPAEEVDAAVEEVAEAAADESYIETPRCTTCDECIEINNRMFAYDDNKQAYIADPDAGTYRELVEAAECCQVAIIHPGKPRNPNEPNLNELLKRAEAFI